MARRKIKNKEQTFEVSQDELQDYYSRYLPQHGPGGPFPATNPWFKIANLGNKLSNFKNVSNKDIKAKDYMKFSLTNTAKAGDLSGDETEFLMKDDGTFQVDENNKKIPNPLYDTGNRYLSMDEKNNPVMLTYGQNRAKLLNPIFGADSERVKSGRFTARRVNPVTGRVEYVNSDGSVRTSGDIAEDQLQAYNAESFNFNKDNEVVSWNTTKYNDYNEPTEIITNPYDVNNPFNIKDPYSKQKDISDEYFKKDIVEVDVNENIHPKSQKQITEEYLKNINKDIDDKTKTDVKYGGQLPKAQNSEEVVFENWNDQFAAGAVGKEDLDVALAAQAESYGIADAKDIDPKTGMPMMGSLSAYGEVWGTNLYPEGSWEDVEGVTPTTEDLDPEGGWANTAIGSIDDEGVMSVNMNAEVPFADRSKYSMIPGQNQNEAGEWVDGEPVLKQYDDEGYQIYNTLDKDQMKTAQKSLKAKNKADKKALKLANKQQRAKKRKMWGDTLGQQATNFGNYAIDKIANSKPVAILDMVKDAASIYTDFADAREAERMDNKKFMGMNTIDNLVDPLEANAEGTRGNFDTLTGLLRMDDAVVSELARDGKELKEYQGQFSPSEVQQMQEYAKNNQQTIGPYIPSNLFPQLRMNPNFMQTDDEGSLNPLSINWEGAWQDHLGLRNEQTYMIPGLDPKTGEWKDEEYTTSFMNEWDRTGVEPTFTFTSAGGPGGGFRTYFPYSDPLGVGWEFDLDPTGPGTGILLNTGKLREWSNTLANAIGDNSVGNWFENPNLPPGFLYAGVEVAGNVPAPFVGATVTLDDMENLEHWLQLPENEWKSNTARAFMHGMGPGLHAWNSPPRIGGQLSIHNPFNVMAEPWKSPDLFRGRTIHNPFSGTGVGLGGKTGIKGGNVIPNFKITKNIEQGFIGGFAQIKEEVIELAEDLMKADKNLTRSNAMKTAYGEITAKINTGKWLTQKPTGWSRLNPAAHLSRLKIPQGLDYMGEMIYGAPGSGVTAPYDKSGKTLANSLRNSKIPYGKFINNPWFWKTIARGLMVPDAMNTVTGAMHQKGQPISDAWEGVFGEDRRNPAMEKYGAFPRMQRWWHEGIDPIFGAQWWDSDEEIAEEKSTISQKIYDEENMKQNKTITVKHNNKKIKVNPNKSYTYTNEEKTGDYYQNLYNKAGELIPVLLDASGNASINGESVDLQPINYKIYDKSKHASTEKDPITGQSLYGDYSYLDENDEWVDLWKSNPVAMQVAGENTDAAYKKKRKTEEKNRQHKRTEMHIKNPYLAPKYQMGGEPESLTSLRRFTEELPTEIGYNEEDILNQKLSLAQMKNGGSNICPICGKLKSQCGCNYKMGGDLPKAQTGLTDSYIPSITEGVNISGSNTGDYKLSGNQPLYYDCGEGTGSRCSYRTPPFMGTINPFQFEFGYNPEGGDANAALKATAGLRLGTSTSGSGGSGIEGNLNITGGLRAYTNLLEENPELNMGALANITGNLGYFENNWQDKWRTNFGGYANYDLLNKDLTVGPYLQTGPFRFSGNYNPVTNDWGANIGLGINLSNREQKYGGEQVDIDEQLLQELITAGADIEIL